MKTLLFSLTLALTSYCAFAQNADSLAYQQQRAKINHLLDERSRKFSQYSQSLATKTGIFGWQTKKDIRRSGEILMDIAQTDEVIFKETKILLHYKTFQQTQVVAQSNDSEDKMVNYMATINKLREQNNKLKQDQLNEVESYRKKQTAHIIIIVLLIALSIFLLFRRKTNNRA